MWSFVDPVHLTVLKRYPWTEISTFGFVANAVYALANGKLLLETYFLVPTFSYVDGNGPIALWDPKTNDLEIFGSVPGQNGPWPEKPSCLGKAQDVLLTNNRTRVLLSPVQTDEGSSRICSLDPNAGTWVWSANISGGLGSSFSNFALTGDGDTLVAFDGYDVYTLDAASLSLKSSFAVATREDFPSYPVMILSQDSKSVLLSDAGGRDILDVYNLATGRLTAPPGVAGSSVAITVKNATGSSTAGLGMNYLPAVQKYPVAGALADGVYDPRRDVYYFTDAAHIRVFSLTHAEWLPPIPIPAPKNAYGPQRLLGIALSPDGSKLAVSDLGAMAIYTLDPDSPSAIQSSPLASQIFDPTSQMPAGVAVTDSGTVYFATFVAGLGDEGYSFLYKLNPSTQEVSAVPDSPGFALPTFDADHVGRLAITSDGSRVYFNDGGTIGFIDTAAGQFVVPNEPVGELGQGGYELVLGANQTRIFADGFMTDSNLNALGLQTLDIAEGVDADYVYGAALSTDGSLLFQPDLQIHRCL